MHVEGQTPEEELILLRDTVMQLEKQLAGRQLELVSTTGLLLELERSNEEQLLRIRELRPYLNTAGRRLLDLLLEQLHPEVTSGLTRPEHRYNAANQQFYDKLDALAPGITRQERIFCSHFRMHFSPVEIADMTQKSRNSVNVAFSRIRTKLGVSTNEELKKLLVSLYQ